MSGHKLIVTAGATHKSYVGSVFTEHWGFYRGTNKYYAEVEDTTQKPYISLVLYGNNGMSTELKYIVV